MEPSRVIHAIPPVYDGDSRVLLLGTMPSPGSRAAGFYYGHPRNRMWPVLAGLFGQETPMGTQARRDFLLSHHIAMWDVLAACTIQGAADATIRDPVVNDLSPILSAAPITAIFTTGATAYTLYRQHIRPVNSREAIPLPSTSPANARMGLGQLIEAYGVLLPYLVPCKN